MLKSLLLENNFRFSKRWGQNFITDANLLESIIKDSGINEQDTVLEIGAGGGTLTRALCDKAKKVIAFEIDESLQPILNKMLENKENYRLYFQDILKIKDKELLEIVGGEEFKVVANLPYYITTPIIMRFIESDNIRPKSMTFMMQKEVAQRLCAKANTPDYGAITLAVKLRGNASIARYVDKRVFYPIPKVDSAVVRIDLTDKYNSYDIPKVSKLIKFAFAMRRKTLINNLAVGYNIEKEQARSMLSKSGIDENVRGEVLTLEQYLTLSQYLP